MKYLRSSRSNGLTMFKPRHPAPEWVISDHGEDHIPIKCLNCYGKLNLLEVPGLTKRDPPLFFPVYHPIWNFCPFCGVRWLNRRNLVTQDNPYGYGYRRLRSFLATANSRAMVRKPKSYWLFQRYYMGKWQDIQDFGEPEYYEVGEYKYAYLLRRKRDYENRYEQPVRLIIRRI